MVEATCAHPSHYRCSHSSGLHDACLSGFQNNQSFDVKFKYINFWASLVVQWLRIHLLMQGTRVQALVWEDPT